MLRHFSELISMGGAFCRGPPNKFGGTETRNTMCPEDITYLQQQTLKPTQVILYSPEKGIFDLKD